MKNIFRLVRFGGFVFVVSCLFTATNPLHAQWKQTNGPSSSPVTFALRRLTNSPRSEQIKPRKEWFQLDQLKIYRTISQPVIRGVNDLSSSILDGTFGTNGTVMTTINKSEAISAYGQSAVLQKDGKIVIAGYLNNSTFFKTYTFAVIRYKASGILDSAFGTGGMVRTIFTGGAGWDFGYSVVIQSDGKIVVGGASSNNGGGSTFALARYDTNGVLDTTFGSNGMVRAHIDTANGSNDQGFSVVIQSDGKIVMAGTSNAAFAAARFNTNGKLDNTFGVNGTIITAIHGGDGTVDQGHSVCIQSDGKIVVAGSSYSFFGGGNAFAVVRYDTNGILDSTFGGYGSIRVPLGYGPNAIGSSVAIQHDGRIVLAGYFDNDDRAGNKFAVYRYNADGKLDSTFGTHGLVRNGINGGNAGDDKGFSAAIQPDGKIVVAGTSSNGTDYAFAATRYDTSGTLDVTFGTNGTVRTEPTGGDGVDDEATSVVIQPDGKIVMTGYSSGSTGYAIAATRYDTNGTIDAAFGVNGTGRTEMSSGFGNDIAYSVAVQSDGKIVVAGNSFDGSNSAFAIARFNTGGALDNTFNANGTVRTPINGGTGNDYGSSVAIQSNGKIVVAGTSYFTSNPTFAVARYNTNGMLDKTFGASGTVRTSISGGSGTDFGNSVAIQSDGKIVVAGTSYNGSNSAFAVARYNTNGSLDKTFGASGTVRTSVSSGSGVDNGNSVAIQSDGKIVVAGTSFNGSSSIYAVIRYNTNGILDNTFGTNGIVKNTINGSDGTEDYGQSVAIQSDGKIVVAGGSRNGSSTAFAVARYNTDGSLDNTFGTNGTGRTVIDGSDGTGDIGFSVAIQPDGKIVVGGTSKDSSMNAFAIVRYDAYGRLDSTFCATGMARIHIDGGVGMDIGYSIALQSNGKIVMAGFSSLFGIQAFAVARFLPGSMPYSGTLSASGMSDSAAKLNGIIYPHEVNTTVRFIYGKKSAAFTDSVEAFPNTVNGDTTTAISAILSGLIARTTYYYRISGTSDLPVNYFLSDEKSFTTFDPIPPQPITISPNGITGVARKTIFVWHSSTFAKKYRLQVSPDSVFSSVVFDTTVTDTSTCLSTPLAATTQYYWRVGAIDASGMSSYSLAFAFTTGTLLGVAGTQGIPRDFALYQNYPNPFNPTTIIKYQLPVNCFVTLNIYDVLGRETALLINERQNAGYYNVTYNGMNMSSGIYFYRLHAGSFSETKKLILLR